MTVKFDIAGDPGAWVTPEALTSAYVDKHLRNRRPLVVVVQKPVMGRMILNGRAAEAVVVGPTEPTNWMPSHLVPTGGIHLLGEKTSSTLPLADDVDQDELEAAILEAFSEGATLRVDLEPDAGTLVLAGRTALGVILVRHEPR